MPANLAIDDKLVLEAKKIGGHKSKKDAVNQALSEYIRRHKQQRILSLFGTIEWDKGYDYKASRKRA